MTADRPVYIESMELLTPVAAGPSNNLEALLAGQTGVTRVVDAYGLDGTFYVSRFPDGAETTWTGADRMREDDTRFDRLLMAVLSDLQSASRISFSDPDTLLIVASAKGNIIRLPYGPVGPGTVDAISMYRSAERVGRAVGFAGKPRVISNACISGLVALIEGAVAIRSGQYRHAVVIAAEEISGFILSGFRSLYALADGPCRPFDIDRNGINLGEGAAGIVLTGEPVHPDPSLVLRGSALTNDANHISGPSRTGEELAEAMRRTLARSGVAAGDLDFVSLHGTATLYNDEMESKAMALAGLSGISAHSLKGSYGHTLGAAGLIESVITLEALRRDVCLPTKGYTAHGVTRPLAIFTEPHHRPCRHALKSASGFGGCNATALFSKTG